MSGTTQEAAILSPAVPTAPASRDAGTPPAWRSVDITPSPVALRKLTDMHTGTHTGTHTDKHTAATPQSTSGLTPLLAQLQLASPLLGPMGPWSGPMGPALSTTSKLLSPRAVGELLSPGVAGQVAVSMAGRVLSPVSPTLAQP